ncbi:uncharacterized protein CDAR_555011 [Caerostris darwini]|uniref:Uncharacterized protein n=1 Tax=Caerostris darwini TaxID=1538125 RepID=A0AAV4RK44_9ARAC|nr:uncharacterized protein CDAR_555011 [Caerostris darwini]
MNAEDAPRNVLKERNEKQQELSAKSHQKHDLSSADNKNCSENEAESSKLNLESDVELDSTTSTKDHDKSRFKRNTFVSSPKDLLLRNLFEKLEENSQIFDNEIEPTRSKTKILKSPDSRFRRSLGFETMNKPISPEVFIRKFPFNANSKHGVVHNSKEKQNFSFMTDSTKIAKNPKTFNKSFGNFLITSSVLNNLQQDDKPSRKISQSFTTNRTLSHEKLLEKFQDLNMGDDGRFSSQSLNENHGISRNDALSKFLWKKLPIKINLKNNDNQFTNISNSNSLTKLGNMKSLLQLHEKEVDMNTSGMQVANMMKGNDHLENERRTGKAFTTEDVNTNQKDDNIQRTIQINSEYNAEKQISNVARKPLISEKNGKIGPADFIQREQEGYEHEDKREDHRKQNKDILNVKAREENTIGNDRRNENEEAYKPPTDEMETKFMFRSFSGGGDVPHKEVTDLNKAYDSNLALEKLMKPKTNKKSQKNKSAKENKIMNKYLKSEKYSKNKYGISNEFVTKNTDKKPTQDISGKISKKALKSYLKKEDNFYRKKFKRNHLNKQDHVSNKKHKSIQSSFDKKHPAIQTKNIKYNSIKKESFSPKVKENVDYVNKLNFREMLNGPLKKNYLDKKTVNVIAQLNQEKKSQSKKENNEKSTVSRSQMFKGNYKNTPINVVDSGNEMNMHLVNKDIYYSSEANYEKKDDKTSELNKDKLPNLTDKKDKLAYRNGFFSNFGNLLNSIKVKTSNILKGVLNQFVNPLTDIDIKTRHNKHRMRKNKKSMSRKKFHEFEDASYVKEIPIKLQLKLVPSREVDKRTDFATNDRSKAIYIDIPKSHMHTVDNTKIVKSPISLKLESEYTNYDKEHAIEKNGIFNVTKVNIDTTDSRDSLLNEDKNKINPFTSFQSYPSTNDSRDSLLNEDKNKINPFISSQSYPPANDKDSLLNRDKNKISTFSSFQSYSPNEVFSSEKNNSISIYSKTLENMSENDKVPDFRAKLYVNNQEINNGSNCISKGIQYYVVFENEMSDIGSNKSKKMNPAEVSVIYKNDTVITLQLKNGSQANNKTQKITPEMKAYFEKVALNHNPRPENYFQDEIKTEFFNNYLENTKNIVNEKNVNPIKTLNEYEGIYNPIEHKNQTVEMEKELRTTDNESRDGLLTNKEKSISNSIQNVAINHTLGPENYLQDEIKTEFFNNYLENTKNIVNEKKRKSY